MPSSRPAPPPVPSHAAFLLTQIRSGLAHLHASQSLDGTVFQQVDSLLTTGDVGLQRRADSDGNGEGEEDKLGKNNAWLRKAMAETSLLPSIVELAMSIAVPQALLGDSQREAIVSLVEMSQEKIAKAVTDPENQKRTRSGAWTGAKEAHSGFRRGLNAAGQSMSAKREEARSKAEMKKADKREQREIKEELKREREDIVRKRQAAMLGADPPGQGSGGQASEGAASGGGAATVMAPSSTGLPSPVATTHSNVGTEAPPPSSSDVDGEAVVSVTCSHLSAQGSAAATTTFSPWPGLLLTSTIVADNDERPSQAGRGKPVSFQNVHAVDDGYLPPPPPRRAPPSSLGKGSAFSGSEGEGDKVGGPTLAAGPRRQAVQASSSQPAMQHSSPSHLPSHSPPKPSSSLPPPVRPPPQPQGEEIDTTDAKQKSWTKRMGL